MKRLLVCGSRNWRDEEPIRKIFYYLKPQVICQGEARGADLIAKSIAIDMGIEYVGYKADWKQFGKSAGPIRNRRMLTQFRPDLVIAFKDGFEESMKFGGTEHMCRISLDEDLPVWLVYHGSRNWYMKPIGDKWIDQND